MSNILRGLKILLGVNADKNSDVVTLFPVGKPVGRILFSYLNEPLLWKGDDMRFSGHSNKWESWQIAKIFQQMGYVVDAINWDDQNFIPKYRYDVVFDIFSNLDRFEPFIKPRAIKLLHLTGSYAPYQNVAELNRIENLERRRGIKLDPQRLVKKLDLYEKSLILADSCSLIGSQHTLQTFPKHYHHKITLVTVSASYLDWKKSLGSFVPNEREFLWFFGGGNVHKGLDLVLEAFSQTPRLTLNVVGPVDSEPNFFATFQKELTQLSNIRYHGHLDPSGKKFQEITKRVFCFIAPSCSESISTAVATCLQIGLFPIISFDTGIVLPKGCGFYLKNFSVEEVKKLAKAAYEMSKEELERQISLAQEFALKQYSREKFSSNMSNYLAKILEGESKKMRSSSIEFSWNPKEFKALLKSNEMDEAIQISLKYMPDKSARILEAGSGSGRVVKYFSDLGYRNVYGIEINREAIKNLNKNYPELRVRQGDLLKMPYPENYFDVVVSYGVVEHFPALGVVSPLKALYRAVKSGGVVIVSVPSFNYLRKVDYWVRQRLLLLDLKKSPFLRKLFGKMPIVKEDPSQFLYYKFPQFGPFFEYRLTPRQFEAACQEAGFRIMESRPISHLDGMYHLFGPRLVKFKEWKFYPSRLGKWLNEIFKKIPFFHNHMHLCVLQKPNEH